MELGDWAKSALDWLAANPRDIALVLAVAGYIWQTRRLNIVTDAWVTDIRRLGDHIVTAVVAQTEVVRGMREAVERLRDHRP